MKRMFDCAIVREQIRKRKELFLFVLIALAALLWVGLQALGAGQGETLLVMRNEETLCSLPLSEDGSWDIPGADGGYNRIEIRDGKASVTAADCPDLVCVQTGAVSKEGQSIICAPHKLVLQIAGMKEEGVDAIAG